MPRDKTVILKLSNLELENIRNEAEKLGVPMTGFIRMLLGQYFNGIRFERRRKEENENSN